MRIVVLQPNLLGDAIMVTPLLRHLRNSLPDAHLALVLGAKNLALRPMLGDLVDEVIPYIKRPTPLMSLLWRGRTGRFDYLIDTTLDKLKVSQLLVRMIGAKHNVGPEGNGQKNLYDTTLTGPPRGAMHTCDRCLSLAQPLGLAPPTNAHTELALPAEARAWAEKHWPVRAGARSVLVNVSGTGPWKFWGVDRFVALIKAGNESHPDLKFIVGGHGRDQAAIDQIIQQSGAAALPTTSDFAAYAACIARADFLVTPDTSIVHIASAFQRPLLGLYITVPVGDTCEPYHSPAVLLKSPSGEVSGIPLEQGIDGFDRLIKMGTPA
jgi:ADP-heptose:LPS heptosyltransferase